MTETGTTDTRPSLARPRVGDRLGRLVAGLVVAVALCGALVWHQRFVPAIDRMGGIRLTFAIEGQQAADSPTVQRTQEVLKRRVAGMQAWGYLAMTSSGSRIVVDVAAATDEEVRETREALVEVGDLHFKRVADDVDFFAAYRDRPSDDLPPALRFQMENAPDGPGQTRPMTYAMFVTAEGQSQREALARLRQWTSTVVLPPDREIAFEPYYEFNEDTDEQEQVGWRTYFLFTRSELGASAIRDAMARPDTSMGLPGWNVSIQLTPAGAARFEELTAQNIKRRFAIVLDGVVSTAPVIQSAIRGGSAQVTMGAGTIEAQRRDALRLEAVLRGGALPARVALENEERVARSAVLYATGWVLPAAASLAWIVFFALVAQDRAQRRRARQAGVGARGAA